MKENSEFISAIKIVWVISAVISALIILISCFTPSGFVLAQLPTCQAKAAGGTCFLCGTSRAFFEIGNLEFNKAFQLNRFSIYLFFGLGLNVVILLFTLIKNKLKLL